ncbi:FAD:protein FMN transferase [Cardiobacteriaceae bacterium TAE3-ERU3]|nr:FAD:protein FMN transferase [Cardiobacteriaceae bacterium TAE3-ERU3]
MTDHQHTDHAIHHAAGIVMGGPWQLRHVPVPGIDSEQVASAALDALSSVDRQMSHYKMESNLMRLNRAPKDIWVEVAADMVEVMRAAAEMREYTHGALDVGLGQAINAWGFGPEPAPQSRPDQVRLSTGQGRDYSWQTEPPAIKKHHDRSYNLSALAKGFAVDRAAQAVRALGVRDFLVEAAGEIYAQGQRPGGMAWQVGLELPVPGKTLIYGHIALDNMAVATSGGYRKHHRIDGKTAIHTFNPQTATPLESDLLAVSVMDKSCMRADALATALFVQGGQAGSAFADKHDIAALFLLRTDDGICEIRSRRWMDYLAVCDDQDHKTTKE